MGFGKFNLGGRREGLRMTIVKLLVFQYRSCKKSVNKGGLSQPALSNKKEIEFGALAMGEFV